MSNTLDLSIPPVHPLQATAASRLLARKESDLSQSGDERALFEKPAHLEGFANLYVLVPYLEVMSVFGSVGEGELADTYLIEVSNMTFHDPGMLAGAIDEIQSSLIPNMDVPVESVIADERIQQVLHMSDVSLEIAYGALTAVINDQISENSSLATLIREISDEQSETQTVREVVDGTRIVITAKLLTELGMPALRELLQTVRRETPAITKLIEDLIIHTYVTGGRASERDIGIASAVELLSFSETYSGLYQRVRAELSSASYKPPRAIRDYFSVKSPFASATVRVYRGARVDEDDDDPFDQVLKDSLARRQQLSAAATEFSPESLAGGSVETEKLQKTEKESEEEEEEESEPKQRRKKRGGKKAVNEPESEIERDELDEIKPTGVRQIVRDKKLKDRIRSSFSVVVYDVQRVENEFTPTFAMWAYAMLQSRKMNGLTPDNESIAYYSACRASVAHYNLYIDSREYHYSTGPPVPNTAAVPDYFVEADLAMLIYSLIARPLVVDAVMIASVVSYLKSNHHATANNLANTLSKMIRSLDPAQDLSIARMNKLITYGTYHGTHAASTRIFYSRLLTFVTNGQLSFSISRRLFPIPPGSVAFSTSMLYFLALERAKFFMMIGKQQEFEDLKAIAAVWNASRYARAGYSQYLYGVSMPEDRIFAERVSTFMVYAASIDDVMPKSTLRASVAMKREAAAAASNDIIGPMLATAYGTSIASVAVKSMRSKVEQTGLVLPSSGASTALVRR